MNLSALPAGPGDPAPENELEARAGEVAAVLREVANDRRLLILCRLAEHGEMRVGDLAEAARLSQSALSQHLARLRDEKMVAFRRDGQTLWYRIADPRIGELIAQLRRIFCSPVSGECEAPVPSHPQD